MPLFFVRKIKDYRELYCFLQGAVRVHDAPIRRRIVDCTCKRIDFVDKIWHEVDKKQRSEPFGSRWFLFCGEIHREMWNQNKILRRQIQEKMSGGIL